MKRIAWLSLLLALLLAFCSVPALCEEKETKDEEFASPVPAVVVNPNPADRLNLRTEPDTSSTTQGKFYTGVEVDVFSLTDGWAKVSVGGGVMEGYMLAKYLKLDARSKSVTSATPTVMITYPGGKKIYDKRKTGAAVLGLLPAGAEITVLAVTPDNWLLISTADGGYAFMKNGGTYPAVPFATPGTETADYDIGHYASVLRPTTLYHTNSRKKAPIELEHGDLLTVLRFGAEMTLVTDGKNQGHVRSTDLNFDCGEWSIPLQEYTAVVSCPAQERLHLRTQPDAGAPSLGRYYNGAKVIINGDSTGEWTPVAIGNLKGYMKSEFLAISGTNAADSVVSGMPILCVTTPAGKLTLREHMDTSSRSLGSYSDGTLVTLCGITEDWAHVLVDGQLGFMVRKYLNNPPY